MSGTACEARTLCHCETGGVGAGTGLQAQIATGDTDLGTAQLPGKGHIGACSGIEIGFNIAGGSDGRQICVGRGFKGCNLNSTLTADDSRVCLGCRQCERCALVDTDQQAAKVGIGIERDVLVDGSGHFTVCDGNRGEIIILIVEAGNDHRGGVGSGNGCGRGQIRRESQSAA